MDLTQDFTYSLAVFVQLWVGRSRPVFCVFTNLHTGPQTEGWTSSTRSKLNVPGNIFGKVKRAFYWFWSHGLSRGSKIKTKKHTDTHSNDFLYIYALKRMTRLNFTSLTHHLIWQEMTSKCISVALMYIQKIIMAPHLFIASWSIMCLLSLDPMETPTA